MSVSIFEQTNYETNYVTQLGSEFGENVNLNKDLCRAPPNCINDPLCNNASAVHAEMLKVARHAIQTLKLPI